MSSRTGERRRKQRVGTSGSAILRDANQRFIARCSVTNISSAGVFVMTRDVPDLPRAGEVYLEMALPEGDGPDAPRRTSVYVCRVIRTQQLGQLVGLGLELVEKLV